MCPWGYGPIGILTQWCRFCMWIKSLCGIVWHACVLPIHSQVYAPQKSLHLFNQRHAYTCKCVQNSPKRETIQMPSNNRMDKLYVSTKKSYPAMRIREPQQNAIIWMNLPNTICEGGQTWKVHAAKLPSVQSENKPNSGPCVDLRKETQRGLSGRLVRSYVLIWVLVP